MRVLSLVLSLLLGAAPALPDTPVISARLTGQAILPPLVLRAPPRDAPRDMRVTGKFRAPGQHVQPGTLPGVGGYRPPFAGQPVQGLSGFAMTREADGAIIAISDNGFGLKANSADVLLQVHRIVPDFATGRIDLRGTIYLSDPDRRVPFPITHEGTATRYLTGADFDPESVQVADGSIWFGDEFGPWLVRADMEGRIEAVYPAMVDRVLLRSPDHPSIDLTSISGRDWQARRSSGFEGLALQPDTGLLWAMLEAPLLRPDGSLGADVLALAFDPVAGRWTGAQRRFRLGPGTVAVGGINFVDARTALVIERDHGNGDARRGCMTRDALPCHENPARVKRLVAVDFSSDADRPLVRRAEIDLMNIADPDGLARRGHTRDGRFTFPFVTVEAVMVDHDGQILVGNDNNLPAPSARNPAAATATEIIRLAPGPGFADSRKTP